MFTLHLLTPDFCFSSISLIISFQLLSTDNWHHVFERASSCHHEALCMDCMDPKSLLKCQQHFTDMSFCEPNLFVLLWYDPLRSKHSLSSKINPHHTKGDLYREPILGVSGPAGAPPPVVNQDPSYQYSLEDPKRHHLVFGERPEGRERLQMPLIQCTQHTIPLHERRTQSTTIEQSSIC